MSDEMFPVELLERRLHRLLGAIDKAERGAVTHHGTSHGYVKAGQAEGIAYAIRVLADEFDIKISELDKGITQI